MSPQMVKCFKDDCWIEKEVTALVKGDIFVSKALPTLLGPQLVLWMGDHKYKQLFLTLGQIFLHSVRQIWIIFAWRWTIHARQLICLMTER